MGKRETFEVIVAETHRILYFTYKIQISSSNLLNETQV